MKKSLIAVKLFHLSLRSEYKMEVSMPGESFCIKTKQTIQINIYFNLNEKWFS